MAIFKALICLFIFWICINGTISDPCLKSNLTVLTNLGARNAECLAKDIPLYQQPCDHYLDQDWYKADDAVIRTKAPVDGNCGADAAAWLKDDLPTVPDGTRNKTMCIRVGSNDCEEEFNIEIKNCSHFFVYHLQPFPNSFNCPAAYCFDSSFPCSQSAPISTTSSTTEKPSERTHRDDNPIALIVCLTVILPVALLSAIVGLVIWKRKTKQMCTVNTESSTEMTNNGTSSPAHTHSSKGIQQDPNKGSDEVMPITGLANNTHQQDRHTGSDEVLNTSDAGNNNVSPK